MKAPEFLRVRTADVARVGPLGACILAAVRYMTTLPGESNGRRVIDGEMWWRASQDDIGQAVGGGVSRRTVSWAVKNLLEIGDLKAAPAQDFFGDRAQAYRASDQPSARSDQGADQPSARSDQPDWQDPTNRIGKIRPSTSARSDQRGCTDIANLPIPEELEEPSGGENTRTARGTRLNPEWMPPTHVIDQMRVECPDVDLKAEHRKFVDHWTDKTGKDATKLDWTGTWRNWIRRAAEYGRTGNGRQPPTSKLRTLVELAREERAREEAEAQARPDELKELE